MAKSDTFNLSTTKTTALSSFKRFPFRSQSLRLSRKSTKSSSSVNDCKNDYRKSNSEKISKFRRQQTINGLPSNKNLTLSVLSIKNNGLIITLPSNSNDDKLMGTSEKQSKTNRFNRLTRHQSIKSFRRTNSISSNNSNDSCINNKQCLKFLIGNYPPILKNDNFQLNSNETFEKFNDDNNNFEDESIEQSDSDENDYYEDDYLVDHDSFRSQSHRSSNDNIRTVILNRNKNPSTGLGIKIIGGSEFNSSIIIIDIRPNSLAQMNGQIFIGDQILSINDMPINENTTHNDTLKLLINCGNQIKLRLKHAKSVIDYKRKWKKDNYFSMNKLSSTNDTEIHRQMSLTINPKDFSDEDVKNHCNISSDDTDSDHNSNSFHINLFLAGITRYISFSDKIRDSSFEIIQINPINNDNRSIVIECTSEDICLKWYRTIKTIIDNLANNFIQNFNKNFPKNDHFLYMGHISERVSVEKSKSSSSLSLFSSKTSILSHFSLNNHSNDHNNNNNQQIQHNHRYRWLSRFLILKGGKLYIFKCAPIDTLMKYRRRIDNILFQHSKNQSNSSNNCIGSLGSVGSRSTSINSDTTNNSYTNLQQNNMNEFLNSNNDQNNRTSSSNISTSEHRNNLKLLQRLNKLNKCIENELELLSIQCLYCYQSDFRCLKSNEQCDNKSNCFLIINCKSQHQKLEQNYYSTECNFQLKNLNNSWNLSNYYSVLKNECKIFTVTLLPDNIIGSFRIDWKNGFDFHDAQQNRNRWSYQFYQLKHSSDDGENILSLTFVSENNINKQYILQCSCLQTIIFSIHSFLRAKVYALEVM